MDNRERKRDGAQDPGDDSMSEVVDFVCPKCASHYKLVRVHLERSPPSRLIHCKVCKEPLPPTDGEYALKYFLIEKGKKARRG